MFLLFNAFLFFAGLGGMFFRMARDNDDLIRACLVLTAGSGCTAILAAVRPRIPSGLALPCLAWAISVFLSSFLTVNAPESLIEFLKVGTYLLVFMTLAGAARAEFPAHRGSWRAAAYVMLILGVILGFLHSTDVSGRFRLWSDSQVIASLATTTLFCAAFALLMARGTVRQSVLRGLELMALAACAIGILQFVGIDPLRPWDPRQPYNIWVRNLPADVMSLLASITGGRLQLEQSGLVLVLPRLLGIHGNPNFYAPYLMQFVPIAVAVAVLDPGRRLVGIGITALLLLNLGLACVAGAWFALIMLAPFLGALTGYASGPAPAEASGHRPARIALVVIGIIDLACAILAFVVPDIFITLFMAFLAALFCLLGHLGGRVFHRRIGKFAFTAVTAGAILLLCIGAILYSSGFKRPSINERLVKMRMAVEMWKMSPMHGVGLNAYKSWHPVIQQRVRFRHNLPFEALGSSFTQENRAHNDLAQMLAETGVLGTGMFLWFMAAVLYGAFRYLRQWRNLPAAEKANVCGLSGSVLVILIYELPNFPFHIVSSAATFWIIAGLLASYSVSPPEGDRLPPPRRGPAGLLLASSIVTIFLMTVFTVRFFAATLEYKRADFLVQRMRPPNPVAAASKYERAMALDPSNAQYAYDYGAMCFNEYANNPAYANDREMGNRAKALLLRSLRLGFVNEDLAYGLGLLAEREAKPEKELTWLSPDGNVFDLGARATRQGKLSEALTWYSLAGALNERHSPSREGRMRILKTELARADGALAAGRYARARDLYADALKRNPANYLAAHRLGSLSVTPFGDTAAGIGFLGMAVREAPYEPSFFLAYGRALAISRRFPEARRALARAAMLDPNDGEIKTVIDGVERLAVTSQLR